MWLKTARWQFPGCRAIRGEGLQLTKYSDVGSAHPLSLILVEVLAELEQT